MEVSGVRASGFVWPKDSVSGFWPNSPTPLGPANSGFAPMYRSCSESTQPNFDHNRSLTSGQKGAKADLYKTELCRQFSESGSCRYGSKCQYAHGTSELRTLARHPKYKSELCKTFHATGFCPYGSRCHFIHSKSLPQMEFGQDDVFMVNPGPSDVNPLFSMATAGSNLAQTRKSESSASDLAMMGYDMELHNLMIGISSLLAQPSATSNFDGSRLQSSECVRPFFSTGYGTSTSSDGWQPTAFHDRLAMGSAGTSPNVSVNHSPTPSPTSTMLIIDDFWSSLTNILKN